MAGLLDFALGFGKGAAGATAQIAQQEVEDARAANLMRLKAQYQNKQQKQQVKARQEFVKSTEGMSPEELRNEGFVRGFDVDSLLPEQGEGDYVNYIDPNDPNARPVLLNENNREDMLRAKEKGLVQSGKVSPNSGSDRVTGSPITLINARGETDQLRSGDPRLDDKIASGEWAPYDPKPEHISEDPISGEKTVYIPGIDQRMRLRGGEPIPIEAGGQSPAPKEQSSLQRSIESIRNPDRDKSETNYIPWARIEKATGPMDTATAVAFGIAGVSDALPESAKRSGDEAIRAQAINGDFRQRLIQAYSITENNRRYRWEAEMILEDVMPDASFMGSDQRYISQMSEVHRMLKNRAEEQLQAAQKPYNKDKAPDMLRGAEELYNMVRLSEGLMDSHTLGSVTIDDMTVPKLFRSMGGSEQERHRNFANYIKANRDNLNQKQLSALNAWRRYQSGY